MEDTNSISAAEEKNFFDFSDLVPVEENIDGIDLKRWQFTSTLNLMMIFTKAASFVLISNEI